MKPEVAEAIRIADKHLAGEPAARRKALALDIIAAIAKCAGDIAREAVSVALAEAKEQRH